MFQESNRIKIGSCSKRKSHLQLCGIFILCLLLLVILTLTTLYVLLTKENKVPISKPQTPTCLTQSCVRASSNILQYIDSSINPCEDFYEFACGSFLKQSIPDDKSEINAFSAIAQKVDEQLKTIVEEPPQPQEPRPFSLLRKLYRTCMTNTISLGRLQQLLRDLGTMPVLEAKSWDEKNFHWTQLVAKLRKHGFSTNQFLSFTVTSDKKNSSRSVLLMDQAELGFSRENLLRPNDTSVNAYYEYAVHIMVLLGAEKGFAEYEARNMIDFQRDLAEINMPQEERRNSSALYHPLTIEELQNKHPNINWLQLINSVVALPQTLQEKDMVVVANPNYLDRLQELLRNTKRNHANYAFFEIIRSVAQFLPKSASDLDMNFRRVLYGSKNTSPKWKKCLKIVSNAFGQALSSLYVRRYFHGEIRQKAVEIVDNIRDTFFKILKEVEWMDEYTRDKAIEKLLAMKINVAYPDELLDDKKFIQYYSELQVNSSDYLEFLGNISVFTTNKLMQSLWRPVNKTSWINRAPATTINAYYSFPTNSIELPAALLQDIFFDKDRLHAMNFGGLGSIIGHELTHGFDDEGRQFDKNGNLKNWWAKETNNAFLDKAACIIDQYANYKVEEIGLSVNGINTQGENIADNGGIKEAYLAYQAWVEHNGPEAFLPGLNYTPSQLFWIAAGNVLCTKTRKEALEQKVLRDSHAPSRFRNLGSLSNSEYFSRDFNCPLGSKMNPEVKCKVW